jgi:hypothetical protein
LSFSPYTTRWLCVGLAWSALRLSFWHFAFRGFAKAAFSLTARLLTSSVQTIGNKPLVLAPLCKFGLRILAWALPAQGFAVPILKISGCGRKIFFDVRTKDFSCAWKNPFQKRWGEGRIPAGQAKEISGILGADFFFIIAVVVFDARPVVCYIEGVPKDFFPWNNSIYEVSIRRGIEFYPVQERT